MSGHEGKGLMKVIVNDQNDKVVGIHLVGAEVAEILQVPPLPLPPPPFSPSPSFLFMFVPEPKGKPGLSMHCLGMCPSSMVESHLVICYSFRVSNPNILLF